MAETVFTDGKLATQWGFCVVGALGTGIATSPSLFGAVLLGSAACVASATVGAEFYDKYLAKDPSATKALASCSSDGVARSQNDIGAPSSRGADAAAGKSCAASRSAQSS